MTRGVIGRVVLGVWLGCVTAAAQLPPEIMVDRYLLRAERLMEAQDPKGALELMGKIVALQEEHGLTFPREFHFKHAQMALLAGAVQEAIDAVSMYLVEAGREGKSYREALELLEEAELLQSWFDPQQTCTGKSKGAECWMEVVGQPGCYVWNRSLEPDATVTWTGACSGGRAQGEGTLKWVSEDGEKSAELTGSLTDGRMHGQWVERFWSGIVAEGPYVDGKEHGQWVLRFASGSVWEGPYVEGKKHGHWVGRGADGTVYQEGPYVEGKKHGQWVNRQSDGQVHEGPYVEDSKEGQWEERWADGAVKFVTFQRGKRVGVASSANPSQVGSITAGGIPSVSVGIRAGETVVFDGMEFVGIPPGRYRMGSTSRNADDDEQPVTRVRISKGFYLGKYEVTQAEWQAVMGSNPSSFETCGGNCPVESVSWKDIQAFIGKLNGMSGGKHYRLPTEAEWEYAVRAGTKRDTYAGNITEGWGNDPVLNGIAWYRKNSGDRTHPVGQKAPNGWGLHDMLGNVREWVGDWYSDYPGGTVTDPEGPVSGSERVIRGGSWNFSAGDCRSANRGRSSPGIRYYSLGFRLLREE